MQLLQTPGQFDIKLTNHYFISKLVGYHCEAVLTLRYKWQYVWTATMWDWHWLLWTLMLQQLQMLLYFKFKPISWAPILFFFNFFKIKKKIFSHSWLLLISSVPHTIQVRSHLFSCTWKRNPIIPVIQYLRWILQRVRSYLELSGLLK